MGKKFFKLKIAISILMVMIISAGVGATVIFGMSKSAANEYRENAIKQINAVIKGEEAGPLIELRKVLLADVLNPDYKKIGGIRSEYEKLLSDIQTYTALSNAHNTVVKLYNADADDTKSLNADILIATKKYLSVVESGYPKETEFIKKLRKLVDKITASTKIADIKEDLNPILYDGEQWIANLHDGLDTRIKEFQKKL